MMNNDFSNYVLKSLLETEIGPKIDSSGFGMALTPFDENPGEIAILSGDMFDSEMKHRLETFDKEQAKLILESEDIVDAYNDFIDLKLDKIRRLSTEDKEYKDLPMIFKNFLQAYHTLANSSGFIGIKMVKDGFIYRDEDPEFIKALLQTRLEYVNTTQKLLKKNNRK